MSGLPDPRLPSGPLADAWRRTRETSPLISPLRKSQIDILVVGTGLAAGTGGLIGYHLNNTPSRAMAVDMAHDRKRGSGSSYERDAAFERDYGRKYDRKVKQRAVRGGMKGASAGAGAVALLQLMSALKQDESPQQLLY